MSAAPGSIALPDPPILDDAVRLDQTSIGVTVSWCPEIPGDELRVFRAKDDGAWGQVFGDYGGLSSYMMIDHEAPADHDYRYVAIVVGKRKASYLDLNGTTVGSDPSEEKRVSDIAAKIWVAGETAVDETGPWDGAAHSGSVSLSGFIPASFVSTAGAVAPDPYIWSGSYDEIFMWDPHRLHEDRPPSCGKGLDRVPGYLTRGKNLTAAIGGAPDIWGIDVTHTILFGSGVVQVRDLIFDGDPSQGFDGRSNPKWQMLPGHVAAGTPTRTVTAHVPPFGDNGVRSDDSDQVAIHKQEAGNYDFELTAKGPDDTADLSGFYWEEDHYSNWQEGQSYSNVRGTLGVDIRPAKYPTVRVYRCYVRTPPDAQNPNGTLLPNHPITLPDESELTAELNRVYGQNANVWFQVHNEPASLELIPFYNTNGDQALTIGTSEEDHFLTIAKDSVDDYSIFVFGTDQLNITILGHLFPFWAAKGALKTQAPSSLRKAPP